MTDWIARAKARLAENGMPSAVKTVGNEVSSVLAAPIGRDEHIMDGGFVSFGSTHLMHFGKNSNACVPHELTPCSVISPDQHGESLASLAAITDSDQPTIIGENSDKQTIAALLSKFDLDLVHADIQAHVAAGYPANDIHRTNNIAFHLVTVNNFEFDQAIQAAAHWVVHHPPHPDEAGFVDVMCLNRRHQVAAAYIRSSMDDGDERVVF